MTQRIIIVGGGLAGLACAGRLAEAGLEPVVLERSDAVGGRVRTDEQDGFLLDRGFQVFLDAYPQAGRMLDLDALDLRRFRPGALIYRDGKLRRMMDPFRCPLAALETALQPIGSLRDKWLVAKLRLQARRSSLGKIAARRDLTTEQFLRDFGFSERMIDGFFRPFYGGIFLERELATSSRMFEFTFKMFAQGSAALPASGMEAIPQQLALRLPAGSVRLDSEVRSLGPGSAILESGERLEADAVVVATDAQTARRLVPAMGAAEIAWRAVTCVYFAASESPLDEAIIALNGTGRGLISNVSVPSDLSSSYAPAGRALISVSVLGIPDHGGFETELLAELRSWFGSEVDDWEALRTYRIRRALPAQPPSSGGAPEIFHRVVDGIYLCGDHCASASIEGALVSGESVADCLIGRFSDAARTENTN